MPFEGNAGQRSNSNGQRPTSTRGSKSRASDQRLHKVCRNIVNKRNYTSLGLSTVIVACIARLDSQNTDNPQGGKREENTSIAYHDARIRLLNPERATSKHHRPRSSKQSRRVTAHEFTRAHKENRRPIGSMLRNPQRSASLPQKGHELSRKVARIHSHSSRRIHTIEVPS